MTPDDLAASMIPVAAELACLVRDEDQAAIAGRLRALSLQQFFALAVVMAAMIPDDTRTVDSLAWFEEGTSQREEMLKKAHRRAAMRQQRGLILWGPLARLETEYQQMAAARRGTVVEAGEPEAA